MDKQSLRELRAGKNIERHLPQFLNEMSTDHTIFAGVSFVMRYYSFYESLADEDLVLPEELNGYWMEINRIAKDIFLHEFSAVTREKALSSLAKARQSLRKQTETITVYTDLFSLKEYLINRLEPKFEDRLEDIDQDEVAREILRYIFEENDNMLINSRIQQMLSQIPVRLSKGKFYDLIKNSIELYIGAEKGSLHDFVYMMESSAGLYPTDKENQEFTEIKKDYDRLCELNSETLTKADFEAIQDALLHGASLLNAATDGCVGLMEMLNALYTYVLHMPYANPPAAKQMQPLLDVISTICSNVLADRYETVPDELVERFVTTEGVLERYATKIPSNTGVFEELKECIQKHQEALMMSQLVECLKVTPDLTSSSLFVSETEESMKEKVDRAYADQVIREVTERFANVISTQSREENRAMMAAVLATLPVFFENQTEVMNYVRTALSGCHDVAERVACYRLMKKIME